jgi:cell division protein FtsB
MIVETYDIRQCDKESLMKKLLNKNTFLGLAVLMLFALSVYFNWRQSQEKKALKNDIASLTKQLSDLGDKSTDIQTQLDLLREHVAPGIRKLARK